MKRAIAIVLIAFRLQSEFGPQRTEKELQPWGEGLNRLSASVRIWTLKDANNQHDTPLES